MVVALLHLVGTVIVLFIFFIATGLLENYRSVKRQDRVFTAAAIRLGIPATQIDEEKHAGDLARYLTNEYDSNKFRNRISDLGRPFFVLYEILTYLIQAGIVAASAWFAFTADYTNASLAWLAVGAAILLWIGNLLLASVVYLATGRSPGEAKDGRKIAAKLNEIN